MKAPCSTVLQQQLRVVQVALQPETCHDTISETSWHAANLLYSKADQTQLLNYMSLSGISDTHWPGIKHDKKEEYLMQCRKG